jgi:hypothetical protein
VLEQMLRNRIVVTVAKNPFTDENAPPVTEVG